jgi:hypothetical protein
VLACISATAQQQNRLQQRLLLAGQTRTEPCSRGQQQLLPCALMWTLPVQQQHLQSLQQPASNMLGLQDTR